MIARIATFEGGDAEEMRRRNNEMLVERPTELPAGILRVMVLMKDENRWAVISFFDSEEAAAAAEERFERLGDEMKRCFRSRRLDAIAYELHDEAQLVLAQERFDCADDPGLAVDF